MPNPRFKVSFKEIDAKYVSAVADGVTIVYDRTKARGAATTILDKAATISANGKVVALCADGEGIFGRVERVEGDGIVVLQWQGHCALPLGNAATCTRNMRVVGALGAAAAKGYVRNVAPAVAAEVGVMGHRVLDLTDTPSIQVLLGI